MKLSKSLLLLAVVALVVTACKKDKDDAPSLTGMWKGKYGGVSSYPTQGYTLRFYNDGTINVWDGLDTAVATKATGTYALTGSNLTSTYTYPGNLKYSFGAVVDPKFIFIEGTYGSGTNTSGSGRFFVYKQ